MFQTISKWRRLRRYRAMVRALRRCSKRELGALGIASTQIERLALEVAQA